MQLPQETLLERLSGTLEVVTKNACICSKRAEQEKANSEPIIASEGVCQTRQGHVLRRARRLMRGPQTSEPVSGLGASRHTRMDTKVHAPGLSFTVARYLLVMVLCVSRSELAPQPALGLVVATYPASISRRTHLFKNLIYSG